VFSRIFLEASVDVAVNIGVEARVDATVKSYVEMAVGTAVETVVQATVKSFVDQLNFGKPNYETIATVRASFARTMWHRQFGLTFLDDV